MYAVVNVLEHGYMCLFEQWPTTGDLCETHAYIGIQNGIWSQSLHKAHPILLIRPVIDKISPLIVSHRLYNRLCWNVAKNLASEVILLYPIALLAQQWREYAFDNSDYIHIIIIELELCLLTTMETVGVLMCYISKLEGIRQRNVVLFTMFGRIMTYM